MHLVWLAHLTLLVLRIDLHARVMFGECGAAHRCACACDFQNNGGPRCTQNRTQGTTGRAHRTRLGPKCRWALMEPTVPRLASLGLVDGRRASAILTGRLSAAW